MSPIMPGWGAGAGIPIIQHGEHDEEIFRLVKRGRTRHYRKAAELGNEREVQAILPAIARGGFGNRYVNAAAGATWLAYALQAIGAIDIGDGVSTYERSPGYARAVDVETAVEELMREIERFLRDQAQHNRNPKRRREYAGLYWDTQDRESPLEETLPLVRRTPPKTSVDVQDMPGTEDEEPEGRRVEEDDEDSEEEIEEWFDRRRWNKRERRFEEMAMSFNNRRRYGRSYGRGFSRNSGYRRSYRPRRTYYPRYRRSYYRRRWY